MTFVKNKKLTIYFISDIDLSCNIKNKQKRRGKEKVMLLL